MRYAKVTLAAALLSGTAFTSALSQTPSSKTCDLANFKAPADTTIVSAKAFTTPANYCRLDGYVTTTNPGPNRVNFMLALPATWNGRYLFTVQGGSAGSVPDPTEPHLREGYAIASTDKGTRVAHGLDFSFNSDPAMALDWAHRGVHVAAVATQSIAKGHYGKPQFHRYVMGCSGGGDGTMTEAEKYPADFDGYVVGSTNTDWPMGTNLLWSKIAARVSRDPSAWISPADYVKINDAFLAKYDAADSAVDGLIWDGSVVKLDASDRKALSFLNDAQFETLKVIQGGIRDVNGEMLAPGFWVAHPKLFPNFLTGKTQPPWKAQTDYPNGFMVVDTGSKARGGPDYLTDYDFEKVQPPKPGSGTKFDHRNLAKLKDAGAKIILWTGGGEEAVPQNQILGYAERASKTFGAQRPTFMQTFIVPGLHHCRGGDNAPTDTAAGMLRAVQDWVEKGTAPQNVVLTAPAPKRTYLLCAYPQRALFKGGPENPEKLDVNDAKNWTCQG